MGATEHRKQPEPTVNCATLTIKQRATKRRKKKKTYFLFRGNISIFFLHLKGEGAGAAHCILINKCVCVFFFVLPFNISFLSVLFLAEIVENIEKSFQWHRHTDFFFYFFFFSIIFNWKQCTKKNGKGGLFSRWLCYEWKVLSQLISFYRLAKPFLLCELSMSWRHIFCHNEQGDFRSGFLFYEIFRSMFVFLTNEMMKFKKTKICFFCHNFAHRKRNSHRKTPPENIKIEICVSATA